MPLTPGTNLGSYGILSLLGAGGQGEVYKAKDTRLNRTVAIKVLPAHLFWHQVPFDDPALLLPSQLMKHRSEVGAHVPKPRPFRISTSLFRIGVRRQ